jgi:hypothetical protein
MQGGVISGNTSVTDGTASRGGGVCVAHEAAFTMQGGTISGNNIRGGSDYNIGDGVEGKELGVHVC